MCVYTQAVLISAAPSPVLLNTWQVISDNVNIQMLKLSTFAIKLGLLPPSHPIPLPLFKSKNPSTLSPDIQQQQQCTKKDFALVTHTLIASWLNYCNALYVGLSLKMSWKQQMFQKAAAHLPRGTTRFHHVNPLTEGVALAANCFPWF